MRGSYIDVYYHVVWPTKNREPYISELIERSLFSYLSILCSSVRVDVFATNGMPDHVHLACSVPPSLSMSQVIKDLKGKSAHFINHMPAGAHYMAWQPGYGLLTFSKRDLRYVVSYVNNQKQHHADSSLTVALERCSSEFNVPEGQSSNPNP